MQKEQDGQKEQTGRGGEEQRRGQGRKAEKAGARGRGKAGGGSRAERAAERMDLDTKSHKRKMSKISRRSSAHLVVRRVSDEVIICNGGELKSCVVLM